MGVRLTKSIKIKKIYLLTISICLFLISVLYFIPKTLVLLFDNLLGNWLLIVFLVIFFINDRMCGIMVGLLLVILHRFTTLSQEDFRVKHNNLIEDQEKFQKESQNQLNEDFLRIQNTINKNTVFDMNIINSQTNKEELEYFNKNGKWPWSQEVVDLFEESINKNPFIRTLPEIATNHARTIYNERAILRILSYQTKEGQFLLNGVLVKGLTKNKMEELPSGFGNYPYESSLLNNRVDDVIKCNIKDNDNPTLERIKYMGKGGIFGEQMQKTTQVDYNELEKIIPGFVFLNKPCNPCGVLAETPDYSCSYMLKVNDDPSSYVSSVWKYLWGIKLLNIN